MCIFAGWTGSVKSLTLVMLNKLRCHAHFQFSANQIIWSRLLIWIHILNGKQCRSRSVGFLETNWSGSTRLQRQDISGFSRTKVNTHWADSIDDKIVVIYLPWQTAWNVKLNFEGKIDKYFKLLCAKRFTQHSKSKYCSHIYLKDTFSCDMVHYIFCSHLL